VRMLRCITSREARRDRHWVLLFGFFGKQ
jgi:hypothetical protein